MVVTPTVDEERRRGEAVNRHKHETRHPVIYRSDGSVACQVCDWVWMPYPVGVIRGKPLNSGKFILKAGHPIPEGWQPDGWKPWWNGPWTGKVLGSDHLIKPMDPTPLIYAGPDPSQPDEDDPRIVCWVRPDELRALERSWRTGLTHAQLHVAKRPDKRHTMPIRRPDEP